MSTTATTGIFALTGRHKAIAKWWKSGGEDTLLSTTRCRADSPYTVLGLPLALMRAEAGLVQRELAEKIGISRTNVSAVERGLNHKRISLSELKRWLDVCGYELHITVRKKP